MLDIHLQISIPIIGLMVDVFTQIISARYIRRLGLLKSEFLGCAAGFLTVFLFELYIFFISSIRISDSIVCLIINLIIYLSLEYCYFTFINLGETGRRIRILRELYDSKQGLSIGEILERYNAKEIVGKRIERLVNNGQVLFRDSRYYIGNPLVLFIAKTIVLLKIIVLGKKSEFD